MSERPWEVFLVRDRERHFPDGWNYDQLADPALMPEGTTSWKGNQPLVRVEFPRSLEEENQEKARIYIYAEEFESHRQGRRTGIVQLDPSTGRAATYMAAIDRLVRRRGDWQRRMGVIVQSPPRISKEEAYQRALTATPKTMIDYVGCSRLAMFARFATGYDPEAVLRLTYYYSLTEQNPAHIKPRALWEKDEHITVAMQRQLALEITTPSVSLGELVADPVALVIWTQAFQDFMPRRRLLIWQQDSGAEIKYSRYLGVTSAQRVGRKDLQIYGELTEGATILVNALCGKDTIQEVLGGSFTVTEADWLPAVNFVRRRHPPELPPMWTL